MKVTRASGYILLVIAAGVILLQLLAVRSPFGKRNTAFAVKEGSDITRIELVSGDRKVLLEGNEDGWSVNRSSDARRFAISFLLKTLREMKIKSPVNPELFSTEIINKKTEPVLVSVYEKRRLLRRFYVYPTASNAYGNIMRIRPSSKPFIVSVPGFEGDIGSQFTADSRFWEPYYLFRLLPSQIRSVEVVNMNERESSFLIRNFNGSLSLSDSSGMISSPDTAKLRRYISYFTSVSFESWAAGLTPSEAEKILSEKPLFRIMVEKTDGTRVAVAIRRKYKETGGELKEDTDRIWGDMEDGRGLFVIRYFDLDPLLRKKSYFTRFF